MISQIQSRMARGLPCTSAHALPKSGRPRPCPTKEEIRDCTCQIASSVFLDRKQAIDFTPPHATHKRGGCQEWTPPLGSSNTESVSGYGCGAGAERGTVVSRPR